MLAPELVDNEDISSVHLEDVEGNTTILSLISLDELFSCFITTFGQLDILNEVSLSTDDPLSRLNFGNGYKEKGTIIACQINHQ